MIHRTNHTNTDNSLDKSSSNWSDKYGVNIHRRPSLT